MATEGEDVFQVPSEILNLYSNDGDDIVPKEKVHQGRTRSFPHVRGNWSTFVFIPFSIGLELKNSVDRLRDHLCLLQDEAWHTCEAPLHISISRTVPIKYHWIEPLTAALQQQTTKKTRFDCSLGNLAYYENDDHSRSFIGLDVAVGHNHLCDLVQRVDRCFSEFKLQSFYKPPSFHVSLLWSLADRQGRKISKDVLDELQEVWSHIIEEEDCPVNISHTVTELQLKSGCKNFTYQLKT